ncbi:hypothetical protein LOZ80_25915 [Paenibacillus sp. HWE-109]|uniref:hypothetical protein n=1 Tax=Paenibacillus sp. HWE-109 TaxID=1306526 RepID=UPI001EDD0BFB|nr:hypothetical protein [Paenibacillus sp. HWE-109]UKS25017.1 hypothetical protein LOZ80_25915 [Paenibacillus sp. HWE-109]
MAVTYKKPVDDNVPWDQRLANYAGNKDAGMSEYQRALEVYRGKSAAGDTEGANAAKKWSDQVNTAIGGIGNNRTAQINNTADTIGQRVNAKPFEFKQTSAPFQYDAQSDPSYQAALRQAQAGAQTATNNAMVGLGSRGIGNSSVAVDRANQIQQSAIGNVNDTILPQLMQQAYGRYSDGLNNEYRTQLANYQAGQDQIGNLTKYAGTLSDLNQREADNEQRGLDNAYRNNVYGENVKQNNWNAYRDSVGLTGDLGTGPKSDYALLGDQSGRLSLPGQQYADNQKQQAFENKLKTEMQGATIANMSGDNARGWAAEARQAGNQQLGQLFDVWDRTGVAPAGIPGVVAGTQLKGKSSSNGNNEASNAAYSEFLSDAPRIADRNEGLALVESYRQEGVAEATLQKMLKEINSKFKE